MGEEEAEPIKVYLSSMEDIKARLKIVKEITEGRSPLGSDGLDGEVACLMLRKVLEQIAFASLVAHKDAYDAVHDDAEYTWRAKRLLERLSKVHPQFYPQPVFRQRGALDYHHFENVEGYLTTEDFEFLYDTASGGLHTWNPFKPGPRVLNFERPIAEWVQRIERLLSLHWVRLHGSDELWLVQMEHPEDGRVHGFKAMPVDPDKAPPHVRYNHGRFTGYSGIVCKVTFGSPTA